MLFLLGTILALFLIGGLLLSVVPWGVKLTSEPNDLDSLLNSDRFGSSVTNLGDLNDDGTVDMAVGAIQERDGDADRGGALHIIFLNSDGTPKSTAKISDLTIHGPMPTYPLNLSTSEFLNTMLRIWANIVLMIQHVWESVLVLIPVVP